MNYKQPPRVFCGIHCECVCMKQHMQLKTVFKSYLNKMSHVDVLNPLKRSFLMLHVGRFNKEALPLS